MTGPAAPAVDRDALLRTAHACGRYIWSRTPWVRLIAVSGSLTRPGHNGPHDDADYFIVAARGRVWEAFFGSLLHGSRFARTRGLPRKFFCFNYLVDEANPEEIDLSRREYVVEFLRLDPIAGHDAYLALLDGLREPLEACEPDLYWIARTRTVLRIERDRPLLEEARRARSAGAWALLYTALKLPFVVLAKRMEARRRRAHPGGHVYSNRRVIRSHFRRSWGEAGIVPDALAASRAFTNVSANYDDHVTASPANRHMRSIVHETLEPLVGPGTQVLDIGCGTGVDAVWLAQRGASVLAVDVAQGMVDAAARRVVGAGADGRVEVKRLAIEALADLLPLGARRYDIVLANFGVLNLAGDPEAWGPLLARLLKRDGRLVATVMNRFSLSEFLAGVVGLRCSYALRRLRGDAPTVGGVRLAVRLYSPSSLARALRRSFRPEAVVGVCSLAPPPDLELIASLLPGEWRLLAWLDRKLGHLPGIRAVGDHFMVVARPASGALFDRRGFGPVTASPVVADINGDGAPEALIAASRLHALDRAGRDLPGWPKRVGAPMASTPAVSGHAGGTSVYVGSDDHRLYAFDMDGKLQAGFPIETGGDVFSSPLLAYSRIWSGSDDGRIYALDQKGKLLPGWPVQTGGFVSASPVPVPIGEQPAIAIGSWDGDLHVLDQHGRPVPGWPAELGFAIWGSAAIADLDGDGSAEIAVATDRLFVLNSTACHVRGFPVQLGAYAVGSPAIGDIDHDGRLEVIVASDRVYAFRDDGELLEGFPVDIGAYMWASPVLVDIDGDGCPEIVGGDFDGKLWAITHRGRVLDGYPVALGDRITASPTAADIDGDGFLELIVATSDGRLVVLRSECPDRLENAPWPTFLAGRRVFHTPTRPRDTVASIARADRTRVTGVPIGSGVDRNVPVTDRNVQLDVTSHPFGVSEVSLVLPPGTHATGMLQYSVDGGTVHQSPLLKHGKRHLSLIQPLRPLRRVTFVLQLRIDHSLEVRLPREGVYTLRTGVSAMKLDRRAR